MINYINQNRGRLVGRNNNVCPPLIFAFDTIAELSFQFIDDRQQIQHLDPSELSGLYFAGSLKLGEQSYNLLFLSKDYTIENDTVTFSTETYTIPYLEKIRKPNTEIWIEMGQISLDKKRVLMRSNALAFPRCYSSGNDPLPIDTENFYTKEETQELLAQNLAESKDYTDSKIAEIDLDSYATDADLQAAKTELEGDIALKQDKITSENKLPYSLISDTPAIPTKTSELTNDSGFQTAQDVQNAISGKADTSALNAHTSDNTIHVTAADKTAWNGKLDPSALNGYATEQYVDGQVSGKAETSYMDTELAKKQDKITAENKLPYSLISNTPDLSVYATEADLQVVSGAVDEKLDAPSGGTAGQVLTKTADGAEWADAQGGGVDNTDYLTFTAAQANSTVALNKSSDNASLSAVLEYSTDGETWTNYEWSGTAGTVITLINVGDYVKFRGDNITFSSISSGTNYNFKMTGKIDSSGNIMTLLNKSENQISVPTYAFKMLFYNCFSLLSAPKLPAVKLSNKCYEDMFLRTGISKAPELPATEIPTDAYKYMFSQCSNLQFIDVNFTNWSGTNSWVYSSSSSGTFYCPYGLPITRDDSHIPPGWTVLYKEVPESIVNQAAAVENLIMNND